MHINKTLDSGQVSPLLVGLSEVDIMKFLFKQNNNNWRKRNGYPMKRKGLDKRKKKTKKYFMIDESYLLYKENEDFLSIAMKRIRKYNSTIN